MKIKRIIIGLGALGTALAVVPMFAAFEAHVINVTAKIENALNVPLESIDFGTVFPQEQLDRGLDISLSQSFLDEDRVDDVDYVIRQKPKCGWTLNDGKNLLSSPTASGHINDAGEIECPDPENQSPTEGAVWGPLPLLCPYLSKHSDNSPENDGSLDAFHKIGATSTSGWIWRDVKGHLAKSENDISDQWTIDLKVPCFGDYCAQDWASFVTGINPQADPEEYIQPIENEHKIFGCDLWVEVGGISLPPGLGCNEKIDLMLVLDRSGSISSAELTTLKTAAKTFVDTLAPSASGPHIGQTSFSTSGSLDLDLSDDATVIKAAIDALASGGFTNLAEGISLADTELDNPGDGHDRTDGDSPDFMVIITDGAPNRGGGEAGAKTAADAAKADGVEIFVIGVGTTSDTADFLRDNIASGADHYFDASNFDDLQKVLNDLVACTNGV